MTATICSDHRKKKKIRKLYNALALPALSHGSENLTNKARNARRITAAKMEYVRKIAGYTRTDYKTNTGMAKELNITPVLDKIRAYKRNWLHHTNRLLRIIKENYRSTGRRNRGRP